jgi:hypothetical protein
MLGRPARLILAAPSAAIPVEAKYTDALVEALAWVSTDSCLTSATRAARQRIVIRQSRSANAHKVARIRACLTQLLGPAQETLSLGRSSDEAWAEHQDIDNQALFSISAEASEKLLALAPDRIVSPEVIDAMTQAQLQLFLHVSLLANGHQQAHSSTMNIFSVAARRLAAVERAAVLLGYRVSLTQRATQTGFGSEPLWRLSIGSQAEFTPSREHMSKQLYTGRIWCPVVEGNSTWLARRNGKTFFTGNSIWWAGEEFIVKTMQPLFNRIVDAITTAYLYGALKALGKDPKRYTYWYDTAPLANSANKLADTLNLYNANPPAVSAETLRREGGYTEADAPSKQEVAERFIKEVILRDPSLFGITPIREEIGIEIDIALPAVGPDGAGPPPPPVPGRVPTEPEPGQQPNQPAVTDGGEGQLIASAVPPLTAKALAANGLVVRALEIAGKKLLTATHRGQFPDTAPHVLHTKIRVASAQHAEVLLAGAWDLWDSYVPQGLAERQKLQPVLHSYAKGLLTNSIEHNPTLLAAMLTDTR